MVDAIVLAGGAARRLDGADKPAVVVDGHPLLDHVLSALSDAERIVVVGPARPTGVPVRWTREVPPGGGPVAGLAAGIVEVAAPWCLVLAADLPRIAPAVPALLAAAAGHDAAVLVSGGRRNPLAAAWRTASLRAALAALDSPVGVPAVRLYDGRHVVEVEDVAGWGRDCDTWADVAALSEANP